MNRGELMQTVDLMLAVREYPNFSRSRIVAIAGLKFVKGYDLLKSLRDCGLVVFAENATNDRGRSGTCVALSSDGTSWLFHMEKLLVRLNNGSNSK